MTGYTKLFGSIITSTIWREDDKTKILWITMLGLKNKKHIVEGSIPGIADMARISVEDCRASLIKLLSPDPDSRTKDFEGRRIAEVDGGWIILNGEKYRQKMNSDERREYLRLKKQESRERERQQVSTSVNKCQSMSTPSTQPEAEPQSEAVHKGTVIPIIQSTRTVSPPSAATVVAGPVGPKESTRRRAESLEEVRLVCAKTGLPDSDAEWFWNKMLGCGWKNGGNPINSWPHVITSWKLQGYFPSQKTSKTAPVNGADPFWKDKARLDLVESSIKAIEGRASHTALEMMIEIGDQETYTKLRRERREIKQRLNL